MSTAADLLVQASERPRGRLPEHLRPSTLEAAEIVQRDVLAATERQVGGWKVGRLDGFVYTSVIPLPITASVKSEPLVLPAGSKIELELTTQFRERLDWRDAASLTLEQLPAVSDLAVAFEFVRSRFEVGSNADALEKVADAVSHEALVVGEKFDGWSLQSLCDAHAYLNEGEVCVSSFAGAHPAMPLTALFTAWKERCVRDKQLVEPGMVLTWGSWTGVHLIRSDGRYTGTVNGVAVDCEVVLSAG